MKRMVRHPVFAATILWCAAQGLSAQGAEVDSTRDGLTAGISVGGLMPASEGARPFSTVELHATSFSSSGMGFDVAAAAPMQGLFDEGGGLVFLDFGAALPGPARSGGGRGFLRLGPSAVVYGGGAVMGLHAGVSMADISSEKGGVRMDLAARGFAGGFLVSFSLGFTSRLMPRG